MSLECFLDNLLNGALLRVCPLIVGGEPCVIVRQETTFDLGLEDIKSLWGKTCIILNALKEEPDGVSRVVPGSIATAEKVGDHAMLQYTGKCKDVFSGVVKTASTDKKSTKSDK